MTVHYEGSLLDWLRQRPPATFSLQEVASFIRQAADALQYAHNYQVIYQKVAPFNFLIRSNDEHPNLPDLQLVDVRRATSPDGLPNVASSMAPEQWRGAPLPASDQYALAILAYQLLTWQSPFQGDQEQMMYQHLNVQPQPPGRLNPGIPPAVDAVILRALAKKPEDRFPSISAFADAFQQAIQAPNLAPSSHMFKNPGIATVRETITPGQPSPIPGPLSTMDIPGLRSMSGPGNLGGANHAASNSQNLEQIPPTINPDVTSNNRLSRSSHLRGLLVPGIVFIIVASSIGFGFYAIVKNNQTATTSSNATVQTGASSTPNTATTLASTITSGTPALADGLSSNTAGRWYTDSTCLFKDGMYHALVQNTNSLTGCLQNFAFANVAIQVDVSLLSGDNAGLIFRFNSKSGLFYLFSITSQGEFFFAIMNGQTPYSIIQPTKTNAIATGNATNTLLVISKGSDFKFYINGVFVGETQDSTLPSGQIGFMAQTNTAETSGEASFSNLKVFSVGTNSSSTPQGS